MFQSIKKLRNSKYMPYVVFVDAPRTFDSSSRDDASIVSQPRKKVLKPFCRAGKGKHQLGKEKPFCNALLFRDCVWLSGIRCINLKQRRNTYHDGLQTCIMP